MKCTVENVIAETLTDCCGQQPSYVVTLADIDECAAHEGLCAHGTCTNTFGSFVCTCGAGWSLAPDELSCEDDDECERPDVCGPGVCRNLPGSYVCLCPEGYVAMPNGSQYLPQNLSTNMRLKIQFFH